MTSSPEQTCKVAIVGGGVIGGGWAARFLLNGWTVYLYDPDPKAEDQVQKVIDNARQFLPLLADVAMPSEGRLVVTTDLKKAVTNALWIQESVPERLALKHSVLSCIQEHANQDAIIASSTSGFTPTQLRQNSNYAEQIIVAHPFNPVYLLPVVEVVSGAAGSDERVDQAKRILIELGMKPIVVRKEIDAHVADRLLEAVWREALWLVKDGIATTEEIDDVIRFGFGLRWAQMGLFETYRLAGGDDGMAHFLRQFGPALKWPWTKLMDVPDLNDELIDKIASQSDKQSGHFSIQQLERIRDQNLVGIMRALKDRDWGVGKILAEYDDSLIGDNRSQHTLGNAKGESVQDDGPLLLLQMSVLPSWMDYNGHMTEFRYLQVFGDTSDRLLVRVGVNSDYVKSGFSYYTVETHIVHVAEAKLGERLYSTCQILHVDAKRLHVFHRLHRQSNNKMIASGEQMLLHVAAQEGKVVAANGKPFDQLAALAKRHALLPTPDSAGRHVGQRR